MVYRWCISGHLNENYPAWPVSFITTGTPETIGVTGTNGKTTHHPAAGAVDSGDGRNQCRDGNGG